ncbi:MAG: PEGA domain-containing protein [Pirellulales bacterium]|nr:PEGA domain-containing protein [Pirellulales bacterium]
MFSTILLIVALAGVGILPPETSETATTRLYVRTVPSGAEIVFDGRVLGKSDGLFIVPPGVRKITIELDGFQPRVWQGEIRDQWITRVEFELKKQDKPSGSKPSEVDVSGSTSKAVPDVDDPQQKAIGSDAGSGAASRYLSRADIPDPVRDAMATVLRQHPTETCWSGRAASTLFAVASKPLPGVDQRQRVTPALLELTHMLATHELLRAKSLMDQYAQSGLTDATTLRQAMIQAAGKLHVTGKIRGVIHASGIQDDYAVGYVLAEESSLTGHLLQPVELQIVKIAYRDVMHRQARTLMDRSNWKDALLLWRHLHSRKLVSEQLYLDAARCFKELDQNDDALRVLTEAMETFDREATVDFLETAGDMALAIETDAAQALAERAYRLASEQLKETISQSPAENENDFEHGSQEEVSPEEP